MPCTSFTLAGWPETKKEKNKGRSNFAPGTHLYNTPADYFDLYSFLDRETYGSSQPIHYSLFKNLCEAKSQIRGPLYI